MYGRQQCAFPERKIYAEDKPLTGNWRLEATWTSKQQGDYIQERKGISTHGVGRASSSRCRMTYVGECWTGTGSGGGAAGRGGRSDFTTGAWCAPDRTQRASVAQ